MLWKKSWVVGVVLCTILSFVGCAPFIVESPRPEVHQTDAAERIVSDSKVTTIVGAQNNKQDNIKIVAEKAFTAMEKVTTRDGAKAVSNIAANAINGIQYADGTEKTLGNVMNRVSKSILEMSAAEYIAYTAAQGMVAMGNREKLSKGIDLGFQWTKKAVAIAAGAAIPGGGLIAFALNMLGKARGRKKLLNVTGKGVEKFATENPEHGKVLKAELAKGAAGIKVDAKKEFDL